VKQWNLLELHVSTLVKSTSSPLRYRSKTRSSSAVFLNRRAAARYRALVSIIPCREKFSWNLSF